MIKMMWIAIVLLVNVFVEQARGSSPCLLSPDPGPCRGAIPRWYYDPDMKKCTEFTYGGCQGVVPFETEEECEKSMCAEQACLQEPSTGPCRGAFTRYFYNRKTGTCDSFTWGACQGNAPFETLKDCREARCNPACRQEPDAGLCDAAIARYFFNHVKGECEMFYWGGCFGSVPFDSKRECEAAECLVETPSPSPSPVAIAKRCDLKPDPGPCKGLFERWYWDKTVGECKSFTYGGCLGVVPFESESDCFRAPCGKHKCLVQKEDVIPQGVTCAAFWTSWYYNSARGKCESFSYSGCSPVGPFESRRACVLSRCDAVQCSKRVRKTPGCKLGDTKTWMYNVGKRICEEVDGDRCEDGMVFETRRKCRMAQCPTTLCKMRPRDFEVFPEEPTCSPRKTGFYYQRNRNRCVRYNTPGCLEGIPFPSRRGCERRCVKVADE